MTAPGESGELTVPAGCHEVLSEPIGPHSRVAIVASRYHSDIVQKLLDGAVAELVARGVDPQRVTVAVVPGAYEIGLAARRFAEANRYAAVITLGCVIRGETPHFEYVCSEAARGVTLAAQATGVPIAFGVLTCDTHEQALERAGGAAGDKGAEAAAAAVELAGMLHGIRTH